MKRAANFDSARCHGVFNPAFGSEPSPNVPEVIYAIPQKQAFAIAHRAILSAALRCGADYLHVDKISRGDGRSRL